MNSREKILLSVLGILIVILVFLSYPAVLASFDDVKYEDGEVFMPVKGEFDFKKFSLKCSKVENYTSKVEICGFVQMVDNCGNHTINVCEWDKMMYPFRMKQNSTLSAELEKPSHTVGGIRIIDVDLNSSKVYAASSYDPSTNTFVYLSSPSEAETLEMIRTLEFK